MEIQRYFQTIDLHTAGEPLRIITSGVPPISGKTMLQKKKFFEENLDDIRRVLMLEPRGHAGMYGCIITPPVTPNADMGVLFMHNEGLSTMCGHGIIAVATAAFETGLLSEKTHLVIDSPAGEIRADTTTEGTIVKEVAFENVPSFVLETGLEIKVDDKTIKTDISFGGAFYAIVDIEDLGLTPDIKNLSLLKKLFARIKTEVESNVQIQHPLEEGLQGLYGVIFSQKVESGPVNRKSVTVFADGQIDRSPCGTGTAALIAKLAASHKLQNAEEFRHAGILDSEMKGEIIGRTKVGSYEGVIPKIKGKASITGFQQFMVDPDDVLKDGFVLK
ncbi:proline racemase family protein [Salsuginibacillus kocurii]|uniref:proline racemase family protein n=1 Tax=Salsuginibacillus kocurii TaxID=427078 RepID=UPI0003772D6E|nr:proline racemase family protein [Salsuginibacillus kocurii]